MAGQVVLDVQDREQWWDEQARNSPKDAFRRFDTVEENTCIDRVQRALVTRAMQRIRRIRHLDGSAVLDYGCGSGRWTAFLRQFGGRYTGVDLSAGMLEIARHQHPDVEFRKVDGVTIPYEPATFDLLWSVAVVHHNPPDRQEELIGEFARTLRDGGLLVSLEGLGHRARPPLYYPRTQAEWCALARRHGLSRCWSCGASYFAVRWLVEQVWRGGPDRARKVHPRQDPGNSIVKAPLTSACIRMAARVDAVLCPKLVGCLPPPLQRRAIMVFQKRSPRGSAAARP